MYLVSHQQTTTKGASSYQTKNASESSYQIQSRTKFDTLSDQELQQLSRVLQDSNIETLFNQITQCQEYNGQVILLIGNTGSGKSTIFNWLNGAKFSFVGKGPKTELVLSHGQSSEFSKMKQGTTSITTTPIGIYNAIRNHLIIDFPGFEDTRGWIYKFIHFLTLNKLIRTTQLKIVVVAQHPYNDFNERGQIITLIRDLFKNGIQKGDQITLILNQYLLSNDEAAVAQHVKANLDSAISNKQLDQGDLDVLESLKNNIIVLRKIKNSKQLDNSFGERELQTLWQKLRNVKPIVLNPIQEFEGIYKIAVYLSNQAEKFQNQLDLGLAKYAKAIQQLSTQQVNNFLQLLNRQFKVVGGMGQFQVSVQFYFQVSKFQDSYYRQQWVEPFELDKCFVQLYKIVQGHSQLDMIIKKSSERQISSLQEFLHQVKHCLQQKKHFDYLVEQSNQRQREHQRQLELSRKEQLRKQEEIEQLMRYERAKDEQRRRLEEFQRCQKQEQERKLKRQQEEMEEVREQQLRQLRQARKRQNSSSCVLI